MKVAIIGSRKCKNLTARQVISYVPRNCSQVISGGAVGLDTLAREAAQLMGVPIVEFLPDYSSGKGRRAPLERNTRLVSAADMVLAFWDMHSRGTAHAINECLRLRVPVQIIPLEEALLR